MGHVEDEVIMMEGIQSLEPCLKLIQSIYPLMCTRVCVVHEYCYVPICPYSGDHFQSMCSK